LFLEPFFPNNAGYEYRSNKWKEYLDKADFDVEIKNVLNEHEFYRLTSKNDLLNFHLLFIFRRFKQVLWSFGKFDIIIVRRALLLFNDYGDLFLDRLLLKFQDNVILDYDDDLSSNISGNEKRSIFGKILIENRLIFYQALKIYPRFMAGSEYLKNIAQNIRPNLNEKDILVLPTCVDYLKYPPKSYSSIGKKITLGWIGSDGNQKYLDLIVNQLNALSEKFNIELLVISGKEYSNDMAKFNILNLIWSLDSEIESLYQVDIGIMPLPDNKTARAKCGFKVIQYMGLGIISVATSITTNAEIIDHDINGFLVQKDNDWESALENVINKWSLFPSISQKAREKISSAYSFEAHNQKLQLFLNSQSV